MRDHWTLDTINWQAFDRTKVDPDLVPMMRAASLVEANAKDYVEYLRKVFKGDPETMAVLERWGTEEVQHGAALGRWAEIADPTFNFDEAFARFRKGYTPPHFLNADGSVRGSRIGELIARCVVECGTSSGYTALRDAADEPVLKQIAGLIAADEFAHYRLFYDLMQIQPEAKPPLWRRMWIAITRVKESEDDELAFAYYCANVPAAQEASVKYDRTACNAAYQTKMLSLYRHGHIESAVGMVARAVGLQPKSRLVKWSSRALWELVRRRASSGAPVALAKAA
ncbi:MAG: ferritin-like domain-containing protein [Micropepsaceae bacterium]